MWASFYKSCSKVIFFIIRMSNNWNVIFFQYCIALWQSFGRGSNYLKVKNYLISLFFSLKYSTRTTFMVFLCAFFNLDSHDVMLWIFNSPAFLILCSTDKKTYRFGMYLFVYLLINLFVNPCKWGEYTVHHPWKKKNTDLEHVNIISEAHGNMIKLT